MSDPIEFLAVHATFRNGKRTLRIKVTATVDDAVEYLVKEYKTTRWVLSEEPETLEGEAKDMRLILREHRSVRVDEHRDSYDNYAIVGVEDPSEYELALDDKLVDGERWYEPDAI